MKTFAKILKYQLSDNFRNKWIISYGIFFMLLTELLFRFGAEDSKLIAGLMNVAIILIPLISIVYGTIYFYNSRDYIELILSQPIKRSQLFGGLYFGFSIPLAVVFLLGISIPFLLHSVGNPNVITVLLISGIFLTFIFTGFALFLSLFFVEKSGGIGAAFVTWLFFGVIYDALIMIALWQFADYPMEYPSLALSIINPVDLGRILIMLRLDSAALMGYTGAVYESFFGAGIGILVTILSLMLWSIVPFFSAKRLFARKNF